METLTSPSLGLSSDHKQAEQLWLDSEEGFAELLRPSETSSSGEPNG